MVDSPPGLQLCSSYSINLFPICSTEHSAIVAVCSIITHGNILEDESLRVAQRIAHQSIDSIRLSHLETVSVDSRKRSILLSEVARHVAETEMNVTAVTSNVLTEIFRYLSCEKVIFLIVDSTKRELSVKQSRSSQKCNAKVHEGIAGQCVETKQASRINRSSDDQRGLDNLNSVLCIPLVAACGNVLAVIQALNNSPFFSLRHEQTIKYVANELCRVLVKNLNKDEAQQNELQIPNPIGSLYDSVLEDLNAAHIKVTPKSTGRRPLLVFEPNASLGTALSIHQAVDTKFSFETLAGPALSWDFNPFSYNKQIQGRIAYSILASPSREFMSYFKIHTATMARFIETMQKNYRPNPYHNFEHGLSVMACAAIIISDPSAMEYFSTIEAFSLLVASLAHDVGHPGLNNDYFIKANRPSAIHYNDQAVLENTHTSILFEMLKVNEQNITSSLTEQQYIEFRRTCISCILATDMKAHFDLASQLQNMASKPRSPKEPTNRSIIHRAIIHAGDLSNTVIPTPIYEMWAERVATEFRNQVFLEKAEGLPVAPNMVVSPDDKKQLAQLQIGFINFVVKPFWNPLADLLPTLLPQAQQLKANAAYFDNLAKASSSESIEPE
eukprot:GHVQ01025448.1.p1 GENE.GHVQ01025448.1~~GHVQ01025448.1.p1  ORF type:complete len:613 (-),score=51.49 GHVQ01025448.1:236-2074(-)